MMKRLITFLLLTAALPLRAQQPAPTAPAAPAAPAAVASPSAPAEADVERLTQQVETLRRELEEARRQLKETKTEGPAAAARDNASPAVHNGDLSFNGQDYTVAPNEIVRGNVRVLNGHLKIDGEVDGDVSATGNGLIINGRVKGNASTIGGDITLLPSAVVNGDVQIVGGQLQRADGSQVHGNVRVISGPSNIVTAASRTPSLAGALIATPMSLPMAFALFFVGTILLVAWPRRMDTVGQAFVNRPVHSFLVGLTSVPVFLLTCATIVGLFFAPVVWLSAFVMGVCAMALMLGRRLAVNRRYRSRIYPLVVGLGAWFIAMVFSRMVGPLYPVMVVATVLAYVTALGAAFSTGFGKSPMWLRERLQGRRRDPFAIDPSETYAGR